MLTLIVVYTIEGDDETLKRVENNPNSKADTLRIIRSNLPTKATYLGMRSDVVNVRFKADVPMEG
jgi:hypothetical protein